MALNDIQERVERSIFEVIRKTLVTEGYLPDISSGAYPNTDLGQTTWDNALKAIQSAQEFAAEVFGHGSPLAKGLQRVPRIVIIPRRIMPGDIGLIVGKQFSPDPLNPDNTIKVKPPYKSTDLHIDISTVSKSAEQDRFLNAIIAKALGGAMNYLPFYDSTDVFFIRQFNYYDLPDSENGIEKRIYSYEVTDLYLTDGIITSNVPTIKEITIETSAIELQTILARDGSIIGPYATGDDNIVIDLSGIHFQN